MDQYIITITKQYASLGGRIGKRVAEKLGIPVYNRESLEQEAAELDASLLPLIQNEEQMNNYYKMAYPLGIGSSIKQNRMFELQRDLILKHAKSERCVIIGRCADYILREYENTLKCYIFAPYPARVKNTICLLGRNRSALLKRSIRHELPIIAAILIVRSTTHDIEMHSSTVPHWA